MYKIFCDSNVLYDERGIDEKLFSPVLNLEVNTAGTFQFKIFQNHPCYYNLKKLKAIIKIEKNQKIIFKGRIPGDSKDFINCKTVECEGKLAFLNDSILRPFDFQGTPEKLFHIIITNHNSQVQDFQKFNIGIVTVVDNNDYIVRSSINHMNSWEALKEKCFNSSLGGYINIRYEDDGDYIDWLADFQTEASQSIIYGENLLNLTNELNADTTYTAIIPLGVENTKTGKKLTIKEVNDGKDYLINEVAALEYGIIYAPEALSTWSDVTVADNLLSKAKKYLDDVLIKLSQTIELNAIDLNLADAEIESFNFCDYINVISKAHGISERYLLSKMSIDITNPQSTVLTLGASRLTLTDIQTTNALATVSKISKIESEYATADSVSTIASEAANQFIQESDLVTTERATELAQTIVSKAIENIEPEKGMDGKSAFEVATEHGYTGTEAEWLVSLKGERGADGNNGQDGDAATVTVGTVITGAAGTNAQVVNCGTLSNAVLDFVIPRGNTGAEGSGGGTSTNNMFAFEIKSDGHLYIYSETENATNFSINNSGHLIYTILGGT